MINPPRLRVVATLLAGRVAFRGTLVLSAPLLLALWTDQSFAPYALAMGSTLVLSPLIGSGAEKSVALLLGRAAKVGDADSRARLLAAQLWVGVAITALSLVGAVALTAWLTGATELYIWAAVTNIGFGVVQAHVGYWRALGRPYLDAVSFGALASATAVGVALVALAGAGPRDFMAIQASVAVCIAAALGLGLRRRVRLPRRDDVAVATRTTALMGANTLLATAAVSIVFAILAWRGQQSAAGAIYLAILAYTVGANLLDYMLRVFQPWLAASLTEGAPAALRVAERVSRAGVIVVVPLCVGAVVLLHRSVQGVAQALTTVAAVAPALLAVALLVWLLENLDTSALIGTVAAGVLGLLATAATAAALLSTWPIAGSALALLAGATVTTLGLLPVLHRRVADRTHPLIPILGRQQ